ncbi:MAG TPA: hypothetical protein EYN66_23165, partial [Myxococcales bacterium]|nr:hypothetical protein [Myxococcales bacterium]
MDVVLTTVMGVELGPILLVASLLALIAAPMIAILAQRGRLFIDALDGFVFTSIGVLIVAHVLPHCVNEGGYGVLLVALIGMLGPMIIEKSLRGAAQKAHMVALVLALIGVFLHGVIDGIALAGAGFSSGSSETNNPNLLLPLAVVLHRLPVGLMVWWLLRKPYGRATAITVLAVVGLGTVGGYLGLGSLFESTDHSGVAFFQALVAGSLLHVVVHRVHSEDSMSKGWRVASGVGGLFGVFLVGLLSIWEPLAGLDSHGGHSDSIHTFLRLAAESAPALLFAYAAAGLVHVFLPHSSIQWMKQGTTASQAMRGVAFGLPLPMCSCGVIPFYQTLIKRGVPPSAAMAFFVATPELGLDAVFLSIPLLGTDMTLARVLCALAVALFVGWVVGWWTQTRESSNLEGDDTFGASTIVGFWPRTREAIRVGFGDIVDGTGPWIIFNLIITTLADPVLKEYAHLLSSMPDVVEIGAFALLGLPIYVCASGATPLVAVLIANGASPGAAIAFLLT